MVVLFWRECRGRGAVEGVLVYPGRLDLCGLGWFAGILGWFGGGLGWFGVFQWTGNIAFLKLGCNYYHKLRCRVIHNRVTTGIFGQWGIFGHFSISFLTQMRFSDINQGLIGQNDQ